MAGDRTGVVVDVGCATHGADRSIEPLVDRFHPAELFGFDPQVFPCEFHIEETRVQLFDLAAWTETGEVEFVGNNLGARVAEFAPGGYGHGGDRKVKCIDLTTFLAPLPTGTVLKLDAEGSEYPIVQKLIETRIDAALGLLLVEWHCPFCGHGTWSHAASCDQMDEAEQLAVGLDEQLACPVERWEL
jgi:FkbM family methyltransferase